MMEYVPVKSEKEPVSNGVGVWDGQRLCQFSCRSRYPSTHHTALLRCVKGKVSFDSFMYMRNCVMVLR